MCVPGILRRAAEAVLALALLSLPSPGRSQEVPPAEVATTEAQLLATFGEPGRDP